MSRQPIQRASDRCDCGEVVTIASTNSPWEFETRCAGCPRRTVISWAHSILPPIYDGPPEVAA
jgi:hypothetical protein